MEIQKFRILRPLPARDINWSIPCSGATDLWPLNTSTNCSGVMMYDPPFSEIWEYIQFNSEFPEKLKDCSQTNPCVIINDKDYVTNNSHCSNIGGYKYIRFEGFEITYNGSQYLGSYNGIFSVIEEVGKTSLVPQTIACTCMNPLGTDLSQIPIFISQDYNDIGHYDVWDGNIGQQDTFGNFILSATSTSGYEMTMYRTTDVLYHADIKDSVFDIDWGDGTVETNITALQYQLNAYQWAHTYTNSIQKQFKVTVTQDTPWGSKSVSNIVTIPHFTYPVMFNQTYLSGTTSVPGSGMTPEQVSLTGLPTYFNPGGGASSAYHNIYPEYPLDSATDFDQFSGLTFGVGGFSSPCYTVSGITDSILGNFQTYTSANDPNLPPGYLLNVLVPIGGDVLSPLTNTFETGVYGVITYASPIYTAYTISSAYGASGGNANGDTPIDFYDFSNGITIFEAESCGLDNRAFGALACIDCPEDDCQWCQMKDEYIDRTDGTPYTLPTPLTPLGPWDGGAISYSKGDIVYDTTWDSCCCYVNVGDSATIMGISPSSMQEGVWNGIHMWEACSDECVSCPGGTQSPCNDTSYPHNWPVSSTDNKAAYYDSGNLYGVGDFARGGNGNCYKALNGGNLDEPTGSTIHWDYVGCVSWDCPTGINDTSCVMIEGKTNTSDMEWGGCKWTLDNNQCFPPRWTCIEPVNTCLGCTAITTSNINYATNSFESELLCLATCSPPAYSCHTPTDQYCCKAFDCNGQNHIEEYKDHVWQAIQTWGTNPVTLKDNADLWMSPTYDMQHCKTDCCVYSSYTWNCEEGCISLNGTGGYETWNECVAASNDPTIYPNPNIGRINQATGSVWLSTGMPGEIPCGWECDDWNEIFSPLYEDEGPTAINLPVTELPTYNSPCIPCFEIGCYINGVEKDCVTVCSGVTSCFQCECLHSSYCIQHLECPTFLYDINTGTHSTTEYGPNHGFTNAADPLDLDGQPMVTFVDVLDCYANCACSGYDCVVYHPDNPHYDPTQPWIPAGYGCQQWTEYDMQLEGVTWSGGLTEAPFSNFEDCCNANPDCCDVICDDFIAGGPCVYWPQSNSSYPDCCHYYGLDVDTYVYPMVDCNNNLITLPSGQVVCYEHVTCECACSAVTQTILDTTMFNMSNLLNPSTGLTLTHRGSWAYYGGGPIANSSLVYESGDTVTHESFGCADCCYVCACIVGVGNPLGFGSLDCNDMEPCETYPGQSNCWVNCNKLPSYEWDVCDDCASGTGTWECIEGNNCMQSGTIPNTTPCTYQPYNYPSLTLSEYQSQYNCYSSSTCDNECYYGCTCDNLGPTSVCVQLQDLFNPTVTIPATTDLPTTFGFYSEMQCNMSISAGIDCCTAIGVSYDCDWSSDCEPLPGGVVGTHGTGCYAIPPGTFPPGQFHDGNMGAYATPLLACQAYCTWSCQYNAGCNFDPGSTLITTLNSAHDCYVHYGSGCSDCNETYFCLSSTTVGPCVTATYMATATNQEKLDAMGGTYNSYDSQPLAGFTQWQDCVDKCRFCCNPTVDHCSCELYWGYMSPNGSGPGCYYNPQDCQNNLEPCCYDFWYCLPSLGCTGFYNGDTIPATAVSGPYWQGTALGQGYTACTEYCGYVCGDDWGFYGGECNCMFMHQDPYYGGDGQALTGGTINGVYENHTDCATAGAAVTWGGLGCCHCYICEEISDSNGGISFPHVQNIVMNDPDGPGPWSGDEELTWDNTGVASVTVLNGQSGVILWQSGVSYLRGQLAYFESGATTCCYVYNGCDDAGAASLHCPSNTILDPHTTWVNYLSLINSTQPLVGYMQNHPFCTGLAEQPANSPAAPFNGETWTLGSDWIPCDPTCPV